MYRMYGTSVTFRALPRYPRQLSPNPASFYPVTTYQADKSLLLNDV